jgi:hypothetical protein
MCGTSVTRRSTSKPRSSCTVPPKPRIIESSNLVPSPVLPAERLLARFVGFHRGEGLDVDDGMEHIGDGSLDLLAESEGRHRSSGSYASPRRNANGAESNTARIHAIVCHSTPYHSQASWVPAGVRVTMS